MAKTQNLGPVSIVPMGNWVSNQNYPKLSVVRHNGATYISKAENANIEPGVTVGWESYWMLLVKDAEFGDLTESNQTEIVNAVLAALPDGDEVSY